MSKTKPLLAVGMILLFIGLAFSPATATTSRLVELNKEELPTISFLNDLSLAMSEASNLEQLLEIVNDFRADNGCAVASHEAAPRVCGSNPQAPEPREAMPHSSPT